MTTVAKFPSKMKIEWKKFEDKEHVPRDLLLVLEFRLADSDTPSMEFAYLSARTNMFISIPEMCCLDEIGAPTHFMVMQYSDGNTISLP